MRDFQDGLHWKDLHAGQPVLRSSLGEMGVRDPFIVRSPKEGKFYLMATDLRIASGKGWAAAAHEGSRDMIVRESDDLVRWSSPWAVTVGVPEAGCVWAPEAVYDKEADKFLVFWASMTQEPQETDPKQKIYGPVTYRYPVLVKNEEEDMLGTGHHSIFHDQDNDRYWIAYHRFVTPLTRFTQGKGFHRETCIDPLVFSEDGFIKQVQL